MGQTGSTSVSSPQSNSMFSRVFDLTMAVHHLDGLEAQSGIPISQ